METRNWRICRICLKELKNSKNCKNIIDTDNDDNIQIITKITYCSQIKLKNPIKNLPLRICSKCYENLKLTYKFCMICQDSERKFQEIEDLNKISRNCKKNNKNLNKIITTENNVDDIKLELLTPKQEPSEEINNENSNNDKSPSTTTNLIVTDDDSNANHIKNTDFEFISICSPKSPKHLDLKPSLTSPGPDRRKKYLKKPKVLEYRCEVCKEPFNTRGQMTLHMKTSHTQAYKCKDCNKAFDSNIARNKHERRAHMDPAIRPHKCDFCTRTFYRLDLLKKHKRVHTGEKPFVCEKCGTAFKQIHHLTNHSKSMTPCVLKMSIKVECN